ncbi:MAG: metal-dependent hydrolase, partial [Pseudomonadota bacterium]
MKIIWLGHAGFRIEIADQVLLVDPWLEGNPAFPEDRREEAVAGVTAVLVSHGHGDHSAAAPGIAKAHGVPAVGIYDLMQHWEASEGISTVGFNKGGTVRLGEVAVTMVSATHSSSIAGPSGPVYAGTEAGFMIAGEGKTIYFSGDTDVMADMAVFQALHAPQIGLLAAGGHFTMDMARAAYAAKTFFAFETVIPCHYKTFP